MCFRSLDLIIGLIPALMRRDPQAPPLASNKLWQRAPNRLELHCENSAGFPWPCPAAIGGR
eukprot:82456-Pyramimonas_sp.AAC.1